MQTRRHLFLIGFMGCGKSYWGRKLAVSLGVPCMDLDEQIVRMVGKSIPEIFSSEGEAAFRYYENQALLKLDGLATQTIIATGGGTPCFGNNMAIMQNLGAIVYLQTAPQLLLKRLEPEREQRPLLAVLDRADLEAFLLEKLMEREPFYLQATHVLQQLTGQEDLLPELTRIFYSEL
ncbi:MAG TPA: shikimate kinase [Saprospiraceae bacterium]|nr:shikimate kinase [Saprospiraceae bacterium]